MNRTFDAFPHENLTEYSAKSLADGADAVR